MDEIFEKYSLLKYLNVSRETCLDFEKFISMIMKENNKINIISKETAKIEVIRDRHIIDSAQAFEFIDFNSNTTYDLGTGGGFPGIVIAIMIKNEKKNMRINLYEKSYHKSSFLREVSRKLNLNTKVIQRNIFDSVELNSGTIISRAFKPLPVVIDLVFKNFKNYKNLIIFMGKSGKKMLEETLAEWDFEIEKKNSKTSEDSFLLNIKNIKRRIRN
ncbi:class I SAM-dependent methyltransferase [Pelagibacterales bacterium SAG-MED20]|nr:class I SAM-dependent methyltransferase [Pelagibacterales bacterium SAG-MED20]